MSVINNRHTVRCILMFTAWIDRLNRTVIYCKQLLRHFKNRFHFKRCANISTDRIVRPVVLGLNFPRKLQVNSSILENIAIQLSRNHHEIAASLHKQASSKCSRISDEKRGKISSKS